MYLRQKTTYHRKNKENFIAFAFTRLHSTLEWKYDVNFKCSSKLQFQGYYLHTNVAANITLAQQKTTLLKSSE